MSALRQKIIARIDAGDPIKDIAKAFGIAPSTVWRTKKRYQETGCNDDRPRTGRPRTGRTRATISNVKKKLDRNPVRSIRRLAKDHNVGKTTMANLIRDDLGLRSRAVTPCQTLTVANRSARHERSLKLVNWLKSNPGKVIVFSIKKNWSVDKYHNHRNTHYSKNSQGH